MDIVHYKGHPSYNEAKMGREIAKHNFSSLIRITERIINACGISDHIAVLTYGSAGGHFLVSNSDTDFTLLDDGTVSEQELLKLQELIYSELTNSPWCIGFKAWKRVKVNPMDLLSIRYICGNPSIFEEQIVLDPAIASVNNENILISTLASVDLHLEFMASTIFSRLVRTYHPTKEFPIGISYGDVKYYIGGIRWAQSILGIAALYSKKRFLADTDIKILADLNIFHDDDLNEINCALDFLLTAKDLCNIGNNIFYRSNLQQITTTWNQGRREITFEYDYHTKKMRDLFGKAHKAILRDFPNHQGVLARTVTNTVELTDLINTNSLELWKTIALRNDVSFETKEKLTEKIIARQKENPHTMLDEMVSMLQFSEIEVGNNIIDRIRNTDAKSSLWMTDQVFYHLEGILKNSINNPVLIRLAVHSSFFELYKTGKYPDFQLFYQTYIERVKKFFHCRTIEPEKPLLIAQSACEQILKSGLFHKDHITLLELHLTNYCNLDCLWCTYKSKDASQSIQFDDLLRIKDFAPLEVLIAGGGEPTLYKKNGYDFNDVILFLRANLSGARLRLITNGTLIPDGDWMSKIDEVSVSLDDESSESYLTNKGNNLFDVVWQNIKFYLDESPVSIIRVTKIFDQNNLFKSIVLAESLFLLWNTLLPGNIKRRFFRFMLFPKATEGDHQSVYAESLINALQKNNWLKELLNIKKFKPDFYDFLEQNTNFHDIVKTEPTALAAERCWPLTHYFLIGADRKIYPCFAACSSYRTITIGTISSTINEITEKRENLFACPPLQCSPKCRPSSVFYGLRAKAYYFDQSHLGFATLTKKKFIHNQIVHISCQDPDHLIGGQGWAVYNLCKEQIKDGIPVYWISPCIMQEKPGEYLYENGLLRVIKIDFTGKLVNTLFSNDAGVHDLRMIFSEVAVEYIKKYFRPETCVIHLHGFIETPRRSAELRNNGYRVISTFHMFVSNRNEQLQQYSGLIGSLRELERQAIDSNSMISVPSKEMMKDILKINPNYKGSIHLIQNGIGDEYFTTPFQTPPVTNQIILSYGRISPEKGFDLLISAAINLLNERDINKYSSLKFIIFGNTDTTIEYRKIYNENLIQCAQEYPDIEVLTSQNGITGHAKINLIDQALIGVVPSLYEPFGMVIPEFMARKKPVITTLTDGARDILQTNIIGKNDFGFIVKLNPESIAKAIKWMIEHPSDVKMMGQNAFERANDYRWKEVAGKFSELYWQP